MKKDYIDPEMKVIKISHSHVLVTSGLDRMRIKANGEYDIFYGGVDDDGDLDPD